MPEAHDDYSNSDTLRSRRPQHKSNIADFETPEFPMTEWQKENMYMSWIGNKKMKEEYKVKLKRANKLWAGDVVYKILQEENEKIN